MCEARGLDPWIDVDGGINDPNAGLAVGGGGQRARCKLSGVWFIVGRVLLVFSAVVDCAANAERIA
jgi:hypothetical protein